MFLFIHQRKKIHQNKKNTTKQTKKEKEINITFTTRNVNVNLHVISEIILMVE